jgi:hypothetical protein
MMFICTVLSAFLAAKHKKQSYVILACYYGTLVMGLLYWLSYDILTSYTPKIFYVSDLSWVGSYLFLLMLVTETSGRDEKAFRHPAAWISPVVSTVMTIFYCHWGRLYREHRMVRYHGHGGLVLHTRAYLGCASEGHGAAEFSSVRTAADNGRILSLDGVLLLGQRQPQQSVLLV